MESRKEIKRELTTALSVVHLVLSGGEVKRIVKHSKFKGYVKIK